MRASKRKRQNGAGNGVRAVQTIFGAESALVSGNCLSPAFCCFPVAFLLLVCCFSDAFQLLFCCFSACSCARFASTHLWGPLWVELFFCFFLLLSCCASAAFGGRLGVVLRSLRGRLGGLLGSYFWASLGVALGQAWSRRGAGAEQAWNRLGGSSWEPLWRLIFGHFRGTSMAPKRETFVKIKDR